MLKVAIATSSQEKINGIKEAFLRFFHVNEQEIDFYSKSVESGVSEQPFEDETYQGALNRVKGVQKEFPGMDFYISCEAGIESAFGQYFNVQVVCIENQNQKLFWGKSAGWAIPSSDIEEIRKNTLDTYLRGKGVNSLQELLGPQYSRKAAVSEATEVALATGNKLFGNS